MDRKWRTNPGAYKTALSFPQFKEIAASVPWQPEYTLASLTDLYAVYITLHIENREWELRWSPEGAFYYYIAKQTIVEGAEEQPVHAPEGDEDAPEFIYSLRNTSARFLHIKITPARSLLVCNFYLQTVPEEEADDALEAALPCDDDDPTRDKGTTAEADTTTQTIEKSTEANGIVDIEKGEPASGAAPMPSTDASPGGKVTTRTQLVIPVSSACGELTPTLLQRFFAVRGVEVQQVILALVDSNATVSRCCLYNYIQAPLEGPGTATLELLDAT